MSLSRAIVIYLALTLPGGPALAEDQPTDSSKSGAGSGSIDVLATAQELAATTYAGFRYGPNPSRRQIDCTQFLQAVVERVIGRELTDQESQAVLISGLPMRKLDSVVAAEDERTRGVQYALTRVLPIGRAIPADSAKPGDLIQYWISSSSGHYKGHAAIIESVSREDDVPVARLYGSHKTLGRIGTAVDRSGNELRLKLKGKDRKVYLVRVEPALIPTIR
ncbi:hypothetical protein C3F09_07025 [candidate division GN15 bacterium]|uniref:CHAP domain-containing protein n=1 Tax=candidate division GN15 bacterium TaxID=2072418 RepID=A0A855X5L6_9BACT|nr:MAG: hypothetical protein C3F09_07025 [candidate division GN15 bacterium]